MLVFFIFAVFICGEYFDFYLNWIVFLCITGGELKLVIFKKIGKTIHFCRNKIYIGWSAFYNNVQLFPLKRFLLIPLQRYRFPKNQNLILLFILCGFRLREYFIEIEIRLLRAILHKGRNKYKIVIKKEFSYPSIRGSVQFRRCKRAIREICIHFTSADWVAG